MKKSKQVVLVTAFEPFGRDAVNSSFEVVKSLKAPKVELIKATLPVSYQGVTRAIITLLEEHQPDIVILNGQAAGRSTITIEEVAINRQGATLPDNDGLLLTHEVITNDGKNAYFNTLDAFNLVNKINNPHLKMSYSAGTYICNLAMYKLLEYLDNHHFPVRAGFIHYPALPEQNFEPNLPKEEMVEILEKIIEELLCVEQ